MPESATVTSFNVFVGNTKAKASEVNTNFSIFRGHQIPIDPNTATAAGSTYDLGSSEHKWRDLHLSRNAAIGGDMSVAGAAHFASAPQVGGFPIDRVKSVATIGAFSVGTDIDAVLANMTNGAWTATLPDIAGCTGMSILFKKTSEDANLLSIVGATTTQLINDTTTQYIARHQNWMRLFNDGSSWHIGGSGGRNFTATSDFTKSMGNTATATDITAAALTIPTTGKPVEIFFSVGEDTTTGSDIKLENLTTTASQWSANFYLYNNSTLAGCGSIALQQHADSIPAFSTWRTPPAAVRFRHTPAPGTQSYQIRAHSTLQSLVFTNVRLIAREVDN